LPDDVPTAVHLKHGARRFGVGLHPLEEGVVLYHQALPASERSVVLGYVHLNEAQIEDGMARIAKAIAG